MSYIAFLWHMNCGAFSEARWIIQMKDQVKILQLNGMGCSKRKGISHLKSCRLKFKIEAHSVLVIIRRPFTDMALISVHAIVRRHV